MMAHRLANVALTRGMTAALIASLASPPLAAQAKPNDGADMARKAAPAIVSVNAKTLPRLAEVDPRFQSFNVEMVEVTGGRFWAPYGGPPGELYRQRPPIDLASKRLRNLTKPLSPAYMRVSGTWANSTYLQGPGEALPKSPPTGFNQVLSRDQWRGVVSFARDLDLKIITSFAVSAGTRGADGVWQGEQAKRLFATTAEFGGSIAAAEFINEPSLAAIGALPAGYNAQNYVRDFAVFRAVAKAGAPDMKILGPGSTGESGDFLPIPLVPSADMMKGTTGSVDAVSYHFYGATSQRCAPFGGPQTSPDKALSEDWLALTERELAYYADLRDRFEPGKSMWLTETAQAACGGSPWASAFRDSFRYVDQLGRLARRGVKIVAHNTLAASDYGLIDGDTLEPRPNYWAALLWHRTMGTIVLDAPPSAPGVRLYAHCQRGSPRGVALAAINLSNESRQLQTGAKASAYVLTSSDLDAKKVSINGILASVSASGIPSAIKPKRFTSKLDLPPHSITFVTLSGVANTACTS